MRLLFVHADSLEFEAKTEAGEGSGEAERAPLEGRMEDCVAAFVAVESDDEADPKAVVANAAAELRDVTDRLDTRNVVLYPCAHLSEDPAGNDDAKAVLRDLEAAVRDEFEVLRAPVGWYKAFELSSKGHPFAERSRRVTAERPSERAPSEWRLLFPDGRGLDPADAGDEVDDDTRALVDAELEDEAASAADASRSDLLRERGIADGEPGERRWYPRGKLVRDALAAYAADRAVAYGATAVETPADGDPLALVGDGHERDCPLRLYETGETHRFGATYTATRDTEQAREEFLAQTRLAVRAGADLGLDYRPVIRTTREFYDDSGAWVESLVADLGTPTLLEILPERRGDWAAAVEFAVVDEDGRPIGTAAVELDAENPSGAPSPVVRGSLLKERAVDALLATAAERGPPRLPTWLAPTQVRLIPVESGHVEHCEGLAAELEDGGVRADVDDRDETVGRRIADAEADWVPYYAVVGDRELAGADGALAVNVRAAGEERALTVAELRDAVLAEAGDRPKQRRRFPRRASRRPRFTDR